MLVSKHVLQSGVQARLAAEALRFYSQAAAACLAGLQRAVDLLQQPLLSDLEVAGVHRDIAHKTDRLNVLLRQVLAVGGGEGQAPDGREPQRVDLSAVLATLLDDYRSLRPEQRFRLSLEARPVTERFALPSALLIFHLLLDNALRRTRDGQAIDIVGEADPDEDGWRLHIHDAGAALTPAQLDALFDNPSLAGPTAIYGLGLSLAKTLVVTLGGRMWADSQAGQGATFSFSLPSPARLRRWIVSRPKVLLIDADCAQSAMLRASYEEAGYDVEMAASAEAGLALVPAYAPSLVLIALSPASVAGKACLAALRQASEAPVVFLVAPEEREAVPDALWQGASDCLVKPFHVRELLARTQAILRRRRVIAPPVPHEMVRWWISPAPRPNTDPMLQ